MITHEAISVRSRHRSLETDSGQRIRGAIQLRNRKLRSVCSEPADDFALVPKTVFAHSEAIGRSGVALYVAICFFQQDGVAWVSQRVLAGKLGVTDRSISRSLARLEKSGLIEIHYIPGAGNVHIVSDLFEESNGND